MICLFNTNKAWGGGEKWHLETARFLHSKRKDVCVVAFPGSELHNRAQKSDIEVFPMTIGNLDFLNPFKINRLKIFFERIKIHTVILNLSTDVKCGAISAKKAGVKNIVYRRGTALPVSGSIMNTYIFKKVLTLIVSNSLDIQNKILCNHPYLKNSTKLKIIYNGVKLENYPDVKHELLYKRLVIGNAGRMVDQKKQYFLLELAQRLKEVSVDFEIKIAGDGPLLTNLKLKAKQLKVENHVRFLGFVTDMANFYKSINLFVITSEHEGTSNALIEAMAWSLPVIGFNISSISEMIDDGKNGYLIPYGDITHLSEKVRFLYQNPELIRKMGIQSKRMVNERFNIDQNRKELFGYLLES
jgi:glycosyltransferase involved in cell wall biosynthesis